MLSKVGKIDSRRLRFRILLEDSKKKTIHHTHHITKIVMIGETYNDFSIATFFGCRSDGPLLEDSKKKIFHQTLTLHN